MSEPFDPYRKWLGIPPKDQPPNHYRLLGIAHFEDDPDVIENAAARQIAHVRRFQTGQHSALSQKVLNELSVAKLCLLTGAKQAYDERLRAQLAAEGKLSSENLLVPPPLPEEQPGMVEDQAHDVDPGGLLDLTGKRSSRWKMEGEIPPSPAPPIVPIPMNVPVGVATVPSAAPEMSAGAPLVRAPSPRTAYRARKSSSAAIPMFIAIGGLALLGVGGVLALIFSGMLNTAPEKAPTKKSTATTQTNSPVGKTSKERAKERNLRSRPRSSGGGDAGSASASGSLSERSSAKEQGSTSPVEPGTVEDQIRQALFLGRQALGERDAARCKEHLATAETVIQGHPRISEKLKDDVKQLREVTAMWDAFWALVREAAIGGKLPPREKFKFRKAEFELVGTEGEQVKYKVDDREVQSPLMQLDATAAVALAWKATQKENQAARLNIVAFLLVEPLGGHESLKMPYAKNLYTKTALAGHSHAGLARELDVAEKPDPATTKDPEPDEVPTPEAR